MSRRVLRRFSRFKLCPRCSCVPLVFHAFIQPFDAPSWWIAAFVAWVAVLVIHRAGPHDLYLTPNAFCAWPFLTVIPVTLASFSRHTFLLQDGLLSVHLGAGGSAWAALDRGDRAVASRHAAALGVWQHDRTAASTLLMAAE